MNKFHKYTKKFGEVVEDQPEELPLPKLVEVDGDKKQQERKRQKVQKEQVIPAISPSPPRRQIIIRVYLGATNALQKIPFKRAMNNFIMRHSVDYEIIVQYLDKKVYYTVVYIFDK